MTARRTEEGAKAPSPPDRYWTLDVTCRFKRHDENAVIAAVGCQPVVYWPNRYTRTSRLRWLSDNADAVQAAKSAVLQALPSAEIRSVEFLGRSLGMEKRKAKAHRHKLLKGLTVHEYVSYNERLSVDADLKEFLDRIDSMDADIDRIEFKAKVAQLLGEEEDMRQ